MEGERYLPRRRRGDGRDHSHAYLHLFAPARDYHIISIYCVDYHIISIYCMVVSLSFIKAFRCGHLVVFHEGIVVFH